MLDRLTDDEPERTQESRERRVLSATRLRESVLRDQGWLFNTPNLASVENLADFPYVAKSTLNFGLPDLAGRTASSIDVAQMETLLKQAIWNFEPRLIRNSVKVKLLVDGEHMNHNALTFTIEADLWSQPLPLRLYMRTDVDLEAGSVQVTETTAPDQG